MDLYRGGSVYAIMGTDGRTEHGGQKSGGNNDNVRVSDHEVIEEWIIKYEFQRVPEACIM